jgi:radical SAM family uncharacterized protein/radical SAM-linked protein
VSLLDHPYAAFLHEVTKPTRYTGAEHGAVRKDWSQVEARICLAFPEIYDVGMSHLGFRILYSILNRDSRTLAERCYAPWIDLQEKLREHGVPLVSLESARPLRDFDVLGFSLQFELTYTNILSMLELGGVPLLASERSETDPLVVVGGPVATHLEPLAAFIDCALIGDGEEAATEIALEWVHGKREGLSRRERLIRLAKLRGVYVPSLYRTRLDEDTGLEVVDGPLVEGIPFPIERRIVQDLGQFPFPDDGPVGGPEAIFDRMSIEVARGCTEGCRFCQAGMIYRPVRERTPQDVIDTVTRALEKSGQDEVSLTALSTADVSSISPLIKKLAEKTAPERVSLGVASLRAYGLADDLLDDMSKVRAGGLTFAPEAGTQRMRDVISKNVTEEQLLETAERVFSRGFDKMKLYFMIGLPTEEDEDVRGIVEVGKNALRVGKRFGPRASVTVSVSVHVPKPHTPFQWCAMDSLETVQRKQQLLRDGAYRVKGLSLRQHDADASELEGVLARGDRRLSQVILRAFRNGARFDTWDDQLKLDVWWEAMAHYGLDRQVYLGTFPVSARLPWDHFDVGLEEGFLLREYRKALAGRASPPCGKAVGQFVHHTNVADATRDGRRLVCYDCGIACDLDRMRSVRVDTLKAMGALEPGQRVRLPVLEEDGAGNAAAADAADAAAAEVPEASAVRRQRQAPEKYRPPRQGTPHRWRLKYGKTGAVALLGHLDLIRELPRVVRRAGVRTAYSEGFHPKPDMSFAPALSLGAASVGEYVDLKLIDAPEPDVLVERLNKAAPPGLEFYAAARLGPNDAGLNVVIDTAEYLVAFPAAVIEAKGGSAWLGERVDAFLASESAEVRRDVKGIGRTIDVKGGVVRVAVGNEEAQRQLTRAGLVGRLVCLEVGIRVDPKGSVRPVEVLEAVVGEAGFPHQVVRVELRADNLDLMQIATIRERRTPKKPVPPLDEAGVDGAGEAAHLVVVPFVPAE